MFDKATSNGNGNKMNMRLHNLDGILSTMKEEGNCSGKINHLCSIIKLNRSEMAEDASSALDLMRKIFQNDITREMQQIMDRHVRTTFSPAIENLKKNGHIVNDDVINELYVNMLESAKSNFVKEKPPPPPPTLPIIAIPPIFRDRAGSSTMKRGYDSDSSDVSCLSFASEAKRRKGRPRKDEDYMNIDLSPLTLHEVMKWNPDRFDVNTRFVTASKAAAVVSMQLTAYFAKYPRMYRHSCDDDMKQQLFGEKKISKPTGRCYLVVLEDIQEMQGRSMDLEYTTFTLNEANLQKLRRNAYPTFDRLKSRLPNPPVDQQQPLLLQQQQQQQLQLQHIHTPIPTPTPPHMPMPSTFPMPMNMPY